MCVVCVHVRVFRRTTIKRTEDSTQEGTREHARITRKNRQSIKQEREQCVDHAASSSQEQQQQQQQTADSRQQTADSRQQTADSRQQTAVS
jgi:hypothetical protein